MLYKLNRVLKVTNRKNVALVILRGCFSKRDQSSEKLRKVPEETHFSTKAALFLSFRALELLGLLLIAPAKISGYSGAHAFPPPVLRTSPGRPPDRPPVARTIPARPPTGRSGRYTARVVIGTGHIEHLDTSPRHLSQIIYHWI